MHLYFNVTGYFDYKVIELILVIALINNKFINRLCEWKFTMTALQIINYNYGTSITLTPL